MSGCRRGWCGPLGLILATAPAHPGTRQQSPPVPSQHPKPAVIGGGLWARLPELWAGGWAGGGAPRLLPPPTQLPSVDGCQPEVGRQRQQAEERPEPRGRGGSEGVSRADRGCWYRVSSLRVRGVARGRGPQGQHCGDQAGGRASAAGPRVSKDRLTGLAIRVALSGECLSESKVPRGG